MRGMKPVESSMREPWDAALREAWAHPSGGLTYATAGLCRLDDGTHDDNVMLFNRRRREEFAKAEATGRPVWDASVWHYIPPALRGVRPVTAEPWAAQDGMRDIAYTATFYDFEKYALGVEQGQMAQRQRRRSRLAIQHQQSSGAAPQPVQRARSAGGAGGAGRRGGPTGVRV